ncbi:MAG TPA: aminotransferase class V-fold PLP-dependent enzyme, partial [Candidatus Eisenbacteria bacterium]|nr:aminotransferase class V-fold PLP-dependent enzyme [Candidatus Eisenbacteria bacterium]
MGAEIYFDNNATTRLLPEALEAMQPYLAEFYGNPSSIHTFGARVGRDLAQARERVAALIGASDPVEIVFTSCGTEGDNAAIRALLEARPQKRHIVTTRVEHPAVLGLCQHLEKRGYRVTWLGVDADGMLDLDELANALSDDTALVSIMYANNETGVVFPIEKIAEMVKAKGIPFHTDAVQAAGRIPLSVRGAPIDMLTISAHKFHGPKGVGALYVRRGIAFQPF